MHTVEAFLCHVVEITNIYGQLLGIRKITADIHSSMQFSVEQLGLVVLSTMDQDVNKYAIECINALRIWHLLLIAAQSLLLSDAGRVSCLLDLGCLWLTVFARDIKLIIIFMFVFFTAARIQSHQLFMAG